MPYAGTVRVIDIEVPTPTTTGADVGRACGCTERLDPDFDAWFLVSLCGEHASSAESADRHLPCLMGHELDEYVAEFSTGRRVGRILPKDTTKVRGKR
jgi:hypothetical protein